jgi:hypothetical protein
MQSPLLLPANAAHLRHEVQQQPANTSVGPPCKSVPLAGNRLSAAITKIDFQGIAKRAPHQWNPDPDGLHSRTGRGRNEKQRQHMCRTSGTSFLWDRDLFLCQPGHCRTDSLRKNLRIAHIALSTVARRQSSLRHEESQARINLEGECIREKPDRSHKYTQFTCRGSGMKCCVL